MTTDAERGLTAPIIWATRRPVPDGLGRNFAQAMRDGAGRQWIVSQESPSTNLRLEGWDGATLVVDTTAAMPAGLRSNGFALTNAGELLCYAHNDHGGVFELISAVPGWVPLGGGGPAPPPTGGITREEVAAMIAAALANFHGGGGGGGPVTQDDARMIAREVINQMAAEAGQGGQPLNKALFNNTRAAVGAQVPTNLLTTDNVGQAYASSADVYAQLNNVAGAQTWKVLIESGLVPPAKAPTWVQGLPGFPWSH